METAPDPLTPADHNELDSLVTTLELSSGTTIIFAIAPESGPNHPVVEQFNSVVNQEALSEEGFQVSNFFYSQDSLINFIHRLNPLDQETSVNTPAPSRPLIMAFGIEQLDTPRRIYELKRLNISREFLFEQNIVLMFWLNKREFFDEFRLWAPDFWDWREQIVEFQAHPPPLAPLFYPYLEWLIAQNSYLKFSGVMQVQRQVDIFLDQVYISLKAEPQKRVVDTPDARHLSKANLSSPSMRIDPLERISQDVDTSDARHLSKANLSSPSIGVDPLERISQDVDTSDARHLSKANLSSPSIGVDPLERIPQDIDISTSTKTISDARHLSKANLSSPSIREDPLERRSKDVDTSTTTKTIPEKVDLAKAIRYSKYSVILGDPGAGKTTLLKYLALHFATAQRDNQETVLPGEANEDLGQTRLPVFFRIADYAERRASQLDLSLQQFLREFSQQWQAEFTNQPDNDTDTTIFEHLRDKLHSGMCLVLLDGLDEVFNQKRRQDIVQQIEGFVNEFPDNKFVITSRIAGYREVKLSQRFSHFTITEMEPEQVERFLDRWCLAVEKAQRPDASEYYWQQEADHQSQELKEAIAASEGVKRMTGNPLLLTILALIHRNGSRLPNQRVKLYELAVQTLIEDWQLSKKLPGVETVVLKESQVMALLAPLAYWMHTEKPSGLVSEAEVREKLAEIHGKFNDEDPDSQSVQWQINDFLRRVREKTGLFVERAPGSYGFMHLTFEEYFAARYIADNDVSEILDIINQHRYEARWHEPILLALGYLGSENPRRINKLVPKLFKPLDDYQPRIDHGEIKIRKTSSKDVVLVWPVLGEDSTVSYQESPSVLQDLLFAGQVLADVDVNSKIRTRVIQQLVWTYLGLEQDVYNETIKGLLRKLRDIERFNQKDEVIKCLQEVGNNLKLSEKRWVKTQLGSLYVACGQAGETLVSGVNKFIEQLVQNPKLRLFVNLINLVIELGEEMTPALEAIRQDSIRDQRSQQSIEFVTALSYVRPDKYDQAIRMLEKINQEPDSLIKGYIIWATATCYYKKEKYDQAIAYCRQSLEFYNQLDLQDHVANFWLLLADCYRESAKYQQALDCQDEILAIHQQLDDQSLIALTYYEFGRIYQDRGKYEDAIPYYQQSRDLYQELDLQQDVANQWLHLADCYRNWGKYQEAFDCQQKDLTICQQLDHQPRIALSNFHLALIYKDWGKYDQAKEYYEQSRDLYQNLDFQKGVANLCYWLGDCYRNWGRYQQAIDSQRQILAIGQQLNDQSLIALAYYQLGRIYQNWGKYEDAIPYYQQSLEFYNQLDLQKNVANLWYWLADCYQNWGKYQQAVDCLLKTLAISQQLDDQSDVALAYYQLGRIYQDWGKYEDAIAYHEQSRDLYHQLDLQKDVADLWYWLANCYRDWGNYQQAVDCELKDLEMRQQLDDQPNLADAYYQLGRINQDWGKYDQGISYYQQSLELYEDFDLQKDVANLWYWLGDCYRDWGRYQEALDCQLKSLAIRQQLDDQAGVASAYYQLGRINKDWGKYNWGKYEDAIAYHQQSLELYDQLDLQKNVANQWYWLCDCYRDWGRYQEAVDCLLKSLAIRQQLNDQPGVASAYSNLGYIYLDWGKYNEAIPYYEQSRDLYQQLDLQKDVADFWLFVSYCYRELGRYQEAVDCLLKRLAICQQLDDQSGIAFTYLHLGRIYKDWDKYDQAIAYYEQSIKLLDQLDLQQDLANPWYWLGDCYRDWGRYQEAVNSQLKALAIYQQLDQQSDIANAYRHLARIYEAWGKHDEANTYYEQSHDLYQQLD
ncbi:tetratricopeptide repeat protein [Moorena sp. SIO4G3]|uniref:tetratricopeptide repeat protein n=1 Tax=Moorena sp. SIO4G3 TaxID=2607821 RepID=UPI0025DCC7B9|nr:tetratricopeptide repeat protein [Moorena sp. SIO4G3]